MSTRIRRLTGQAVMLSCVTAAASFAMATSAHAQTTTLSFTTAGEHAFTIPAGVSSIHVVAVGGTGGSYARSGGEGAVVTADLPVAVGRRYYAEVGGNGATVTDSINNGAGGGGGASDIRTISTTTSTGSSGLSSRLLVAGGGGGSGYDAGGNAGSPGLAMGSNNGGGAGTATAGGSGGGCGTGLRVACGSPGSFGAGGSGGSDYPSTEGGGANGGGPAGGVGPYEEPGGGGGGGWYGGGGGGNDLEGSNVVAGGGGGGSSLVPSGGTVTLDTTASPHITITYTIPATPTTTSLVALPSLAVHALTPVTLDATVHAEVSSGSTLLPSGSGSVQFYAYEGGYSFVALGTPVTINGVGLAVKISTLPQGTVDVLATFIPKDSGLYDASNSPLVPVTVL